METIDKIKQMISDGVLTQEDAEKYFPELKESEELGIKKNIQYAVRCTYGDNSEKTAKIMAWLDNQETKTIEEINGEDHVIDGLETALHILEKTYGKVQGYQTDDGMLEHQRAITALKKLCEQKPIEWTDNDEYIRNSILHTLDIKKCLSEKNGDSEAAKKWHTYYNWFKTRCPKNS